jgi:hypothetical protein
MRAHKTSSAMIMIDLWWRRPMDCRDRDGHQPGRSALLGPTVLYVGRERTASGAVAVSARAKTTGAG